MTQSIRFGQIRSITLGALVALALSGAIFAGVSVSRAQTTSAMPAPAISTAPSNAPAPMVVSVDASGTVLVRGVVQSVSGDTLTLNSWGGTWTIRSTSASDVTPASSVGAGDLSSIAPGDFVGASGVIAPDQVWTVNAAVVRDWTRTAVSAPVTTGTSGSTTTSVSGLPTGDALYTGTVSNVSGASFTLTDSSGNAYTVNENSGATLWDTNGATISADSIQNGDQIRLDGVLNGSSLSADVVRDTTTIE